MHRQTETKGQRDRKEKGKNVQEKRAVGMLMLPFSLRVLQMFSMHRVMWVRSQDLVDV